MLCPLYRELQCLLPKRRGPDRRHAGIEPPKKEQGGPMKGRVLGGRSW
jgi:hypothetical protein